MTFIKKTTTEIMNKSFLHIAFAVVLLGISTTAFAQGKGSRWSKEMLDYKHDFIAEQTQMTQVQRDKFMPLYEAMEKEIYAVNKETGHQARKVSATNRKVTDQEYINAARAMQNAKIKEGQIENRYFEKFSKILSPKQMFLLKQSERKFTRQMISRGKHK